MPIIKSAKKRVKVAAKANARNSLHKRRVRDALKAFNKAIESGKPAEVAKAEKAAVSALDIAAKKAIVHRNKAARQKSQLSARAKAAGAKPTKSAAKPTAAKKAPAKKTPAKKPAPKTSAKS